MRGDLSLAVDRARYMYESAKDTNSNFGIALPIKPSVRHILPLTYRTRP